MKDIIPKFIIVEDAVEKGIVATARDHGFTELKVKNWVRESLAKVDRDFHRNEIKLKKIREEIKQIQEEQMQIQESILEKLKHSSIKDLATPAQLEEL
ncbi:hypothetical protein Tco_1425362, partial [Tanacetum coccineum]